MALNLTTCINFLIKVCAGIPTQKCDDGKPTNSCGKNQQPDICGHLCEPSCTNPNPKFCPTIVSYLFKFIIDYFSSILSFINL